MPEAKASSDELLFMVTLKDGYALQSFLQQRNELSSMWEMGSRLMDPDQIQTQHYSSGIGIIG